MAAIDRLSLAQVPGERHRAAALADALLQARHAETVVRLYDGSARVGRVLAWAGFHGMPVLAASLPHVLDRLEE